MTAEHKRAWKCQACRCKMPKQDNTNTPIRSICDKQLPCALTATDEINNITMRRKASTIQQKNTTKTLDLSIDDQIADDNSISGVTINNTTDCQEMNLSKTTIDQLCALLSEKLDTNRQTLLYELKTIVQQEISSAISDIKSDYTQRTDALKYEQEEIKLKITALNEKIQNLETQLENYKNNKLQTTDSKLTSKEFSSYNNNKKIVLHGLEEYQGETEASVYDRVVQLFYDVLNINLEGYVEQLTRIGRRGFQRPLEIELISKRMTKLVLENSNYLQNTQFSVTEYLDAGELKKRRELRKVLKEARDNGKYAILRNGRLFINGNEYQNTSEININTTPQPNHTAVTESKPSKGKPTNSNKTTPNSGQLNQPFLVRN